MMMLNKSQIVLICANSFGIINFLQHLRPLNRIISEGTYNNRLEGDFYEKKDGVINFFILPDGRWDFVRETIKGGRVE